MLHSCMIDAASLLPSVQTTMMKRMRRPKSDLATSGHQLDLSRAQKLVMELMAIPAKSGEEAPVAAYIREKLLAAGAPADAIVTDNAQKHALIKGNTGNLILKLPGTLKGPMRMLTAHMDTVPICIGSQPKMQGDFVRSANP